MKNSVVFRELSETNSRQVVCAAAGSAAGAARGMEVSEEMKEEIRRSQADLRSAIRAHQGWVARLREGGANPLIERKVEEAERNILAVSQNQKRVVDRLRRELELYQQRLKLRNKQVNIENDNRYVAQQLRDHQIQYRSKNRIISLLKPSVLSEIHIKTENTNGDLIPASDASDSETKMSNDVEGKENGSYGEETALREKCDGKFPNSVHDSRNNFTNALNKVKESFMGAKLKSDIESWQQGSVPRSSDSDNSLPGAGTDPSPSPSPPPLPDTGDAVSQETFMRIIGLVTHRQKEALEKKRRERRKRSTNRNEFVYDSFDIPPKRKKYNQFPYLQTCTPPQTRSQRLRKQQKQNASENASREGSPSGSSGDNKGGSNSWNNSSKPEWMSSLPSELDVHPIHPKKSCARCGRSDVPSLLVWCSGCDVHLHTGCGDGGRCPDCKRALPDPAHTPTTLHQQQIKDKLKERKRLQEENIRLCADLRKLEARRANIEENLDENSAKKRDLLASQIRTQRDLQKLLDFVGQFKETSISIRSTSMSETGSELSKSNEE